MISSYTSTAPNRQRIIIISTHIITNGQAGIILNILKNHSADLSDAVQLTFAIAFVNARVILRPRAAKIRVGVCGISQRHDAVVAARSRARTVADDRHNDGFFFLCVRFTAGFAVRCFCVLCFFVSPVADVSVCTDSSAAHSGGADHICTLIASNTAATSLLARISLLLTSSISLIHRFYLFKPDALLRGCSICSSRRTSSSE